MIFIVVSATSVRRVAELESARPVTSPRGFRGSPDSFSKSIAASLQEMRCGDSE